MTVSSKSKPYALLIEENIRHSDELCRVLNSNTSQIGLLTIELDHLAADYQDGQKIQDMTAEAYHGRLALIQTESRKLDDMIGTLAGEILKKMENLLVILSRPTISKQTLLGLSEIGYDINLIVVSENALTESRKVVDVHHKYLFSRIQCYQANKMRFLSKLSLANSRDVLKPKQTYLGMAFSWFSGSEKEDEIVNEKLALSTESPGWVKKLWDTKYEELPELPEDVLMRTLGVLLSQKPYNPSKKESSLVSSMKFAPLNLANLRERGLSLDAASVIENSQAGSLISNQFKSDCMEEMVDSTPSLHRLTRTTHDSSHPATSLKRESSELRKSSATDTDLYPQSKEPSSKDRLTEIPFNQFSRQANTDTLVLTESAMNYHLINQLAQDRLDEMNASIPVMNTLLEELEKKQKIFISEVYEKKKSGAKDPASNEEEFYKFLKDSVVTYLNIRDLSANSFFSLRDLNRATKTVQSWNLDSCTIQTLEGLRFPIAPILQIREQDLKAKILICESNEKSKIFSSLKSKLATKLDEALYNLKWAKSKLEFYERGYFVFGANSFYLNEEITELEKERSQRNPSFIVMEDSASFF